MTRVGLFAIILALLLTVRAPVAATLSCAEAASVAETEASMPSGLLLAIGMVESGRVDATGRRAPWPWTINAGGLGRFFDSADDAVRMVRSLRASGVESIDIGCFQINLLHHPDAFPDLLSGFDPLINAREAARFLVSLHAEFADWGPAIAAYHSRTETVGMPYRERVLAAWHGTGVPSAASAGGPRLVAMMGSRATAFAGVHVWGPDGASDVYVLPTAWTHVSVTAGPARRRLPRIVTPSLH